MKTAPLSTPAITFAAILGVLAVASAIKPAPALGADSPAAAPRQAVHRVTGLFAPDREADLRAAVEKLPGVKLVSLDFDYAEATFSYDPAEAFPGTEPGKIVERFNELLLNASGHFFGIREASTTPRDKLTRIEIAIVAIDCKACCLGVYEILERQDGVLQATVGLKDGRASALIDPAKTSLEKLVAALKQSEVAVE